MDSSIENQILISQLYPLQSKDIMDRLCELPNLTAFGLDCVPRITRAQKLDTLSSMTNLSGYKATLEAFTHLPRFSKQVITAAGKIEPSQTFIIGAGVAGLAAISVSRALGSVVKAFDSRTNVKE